MGKENMEQIPLHPCFHETCTIPHPEPLEVSKWSKTYPQDPSPQPSTEWFYFPAHPDQHTQQLSPSHSQPQNEQWPELLAKDNLVPHYFSGFSPLKRWPCSDQDKFCMCLIDHNRRRIWYWVWTGFLNMRIVQYWRNKNRGWLRNWEHIRLTGKVW